jgi:hypothetical protein
MLLNFVPKNAREKIQFGGISHQLFYNSICNIFLFSNNVEVSVVHLSNTFKTNNSMIVKSFVLIASTAIFLSSCSDNKTEESVEKTETENLSIQAPAPDSAGVDKIAAPVNQAPSQVSIPTEKATGSPALNPAHGQPGHRCDLAVGAPLPSAEKNNTTVTAPVKPSEVKLTEIKPALNPAHGEPGHRCDLQVGAPLNTPSTPVSK